MVVALKWPKYSIFIFFIFFLLNQFNNHAIGEDDTTLVNVGPILSTDGEAIVGAKVKIFYNNTTYIGYSESNGYASIKLPKSAIGTDVSGIVEKDGYSSVTFIIGIRPGGRIKGSIPPLQKIHTQDDTSNIPWSLSALHLAIIMFIMACVFLATAYYYRKKEE